METPTNSFLFVGACINIVNPVFPKCFYLIRDDGEEFLCNNEEEKNKALSTSRNWKVMILFNKPYSKEGQ